MNKAIEVVATWHSLTPSSCWHLIFKCPLLFWVILYYDTFFLLHTCSLCTCTYTNNFIHHSVLDGILFIPYYIWKYRQLFKKKLHFIRKREMLYSAYKETDLKSYFFNRFTLFWVQINFQSLCRDLYMLILIFNV